MIYTSPCRHVSCTPEETRDQSKDHPPLPPWCIAFDRQSSQSTSMGHLPQTQVMQKWFQTTRKLRYKGEGNVYIIMRRDQIIILEI